MDVRTARREVERATAILEHPRASVAFDLQRLGLELDHEPLRRAARRLGVLEAMREIRDRTALALDALPADDPSIEAARIHGALAAYALEDFGGCRRLLEAAGITSDGDRPGSDLHAWCRLLGGERDAVRDLASGRSGFAWAWLEARLLADEGREDEALARLTAAAPPAPPPRAPAGRVRLLEVLGWLGWVAMLVAALVLSADDPGLRVVLVGILLLSAVPVILTRARRQGGTESPCAARCAGSRLVARLPAGRRARLDAWIAAG